MKIFIKIIILLITLIIGENPILKGQVNLESVIKKEVKKLNRQNIDSVIEYYMMPPTMDSLGPKISSQIFWKVKGTTYIKRFSQWEWTKDQTVKIEMFVNLDSNLFSYLSQNFQKLLNDELLPFIYRDTVNNLETFKVVSNSFHKQSETIVVYTKAGNFSKQIQPMHLFKDLGEPVKNLNYEYNKSCPSIILLSLIKNCISTAVMK